MSDIIKINMPFDRRQLLGLRAGDDVLLTGTIYTARDAAHKRFTETLDKGEPLPLSLDNQAIYYCGPTPPTPNRCIGSAGPTTSSRMDKYTPNILRKTGLAAMIGKGSRSTEVISAIMETGAVYFAAIGGGGAMIAERILQAETVCYHDLGPEAVYKLYVENMPLIVAIDSEGNNLYESGPKEYLSSRKDAQGF